MAQFSERRKECLLLFDDFLMGTYEELDGNMIPCALT